MIKQNFQMEPFCLHIPEIAFFPLSQKKAIKSQFIYIADFKNVSFFGSFEKLYLR